MKIAVFLPNWVGDVAMATPTLRALRSRFPQAKVIGIMKPAMADVLEGTALLDEWWPYSGRGPRDRSFWKNAWRLFRGRFDLAILLTNNLQTAQLAWFGRVKERVGYARYNRESWLTRSLIPPMENGAFKPFPAVDYYLALAYAVDCANETPEIELHVNTSDEILAATSFRELGIGAERGVVTFNSSGAFGAAKLWPEEYFVALAKRIVSELSHDVLVICGPNEAERAARIAEAAGSRHVASLAGRPLSIGLSKACVRRSRLLVSTDSGPRHFAAAFDVPVVSLFGPTHIAWSDTHYEKEMKLQVAVDCGPCQQRVCPETHHKCMRDLSIETVFSAVQQSLQTTKV